MASVIFAGQSGNLQESLIILPLMIYHALQLFLAGILSGNFSSETQAQSKD
jgi:predicted Na+-dependent transporter